MTNKINFTENDKIARAITFAFDAHQGQTRKGSSESYIIHPLRVLSSLIKLGIDDVDLLCAAVLHDTVEDCDVTIEQIADLFGQEIAEIVDILTEDKTLERSKRKELTRVKIASAPAKVKLIKAADRYDNLQGAFPSFWSEEKKQQYLKESKLLIEALVKNIYDDTYCDFVQQFAREIASKINREEQNK